MKRYACSLLFVVLFASLSGLSHASSIEFNSSNFGYTIGSFNGGNSDGSSVNFFAGDANMSLHNTNTDPNSWTYISLWKYNNNIPLNNDFTASMTFDNFNHSFGGSRLAFGFYDGSGWEMIGINNNDQYQTWRTSEQGQGWYSDPDITNTTGSGTFVLEKNGSLLTLSVLGTGFSHSYNNVAITNNSEFSTGSYVFGPGHMEVRLTDFQYDTSSTPVPEPATMLLLGSGLMGLAGYGRNKFRKA